MEPEVFSAFTGLAGVMVGGLAAVAVALIRNRKNHKGHNPGNPNGILAEVRRCHEVQMAKHDEALSVVKTIELLLRERLPRGS